MVSHFEGRQQLFPRKMSTILTNGRQFTVFNEEQTLNECIKANFVDCRINAYPVLEDSGLLAIQAPNIIFIDIDLSKYYNNEQGLIELNKTLRMTLYAIDKSLNGCKPTTI